MRDVVDGHLRPQVLVLGDELLVQRMHLIGAFVLDAVEGQDFGHAITRIDHVAIAGRGRRSHDQRTHALDRGQTAHAGDQRVAIGDRVRVFQPEEYRVRDHAVPFLREAGLWIDRPRASGKTGTLGTEQIHG